jgi:hypothetical protein
LTSNPFGAERCDLDPNLLELLPRHPPELLDRPDEAHRGVHALDYQASITGTGRPTRMK